MLDVSGDDIAELNDEDLRNLVGRLCEAELRARNLSVSCVTWGGNQNAADGGVDVRVRLAATSAASGFIPRVNTVYQVKKTDFTPALIAPEICPQGKMRSSIKSLIDEQGAYIIVSSGANTSDSALRERIDAMRAASATADPDGALALDFYDRTRIATWVRTHPGVILWVRARIGRALTGWRPYGSWANSPDGTEDVYLFDDKARLHIGTSDDKGISVKDGVKKMRAALCSPKGVLRLAGLSGVGKTRLVQALFDPRLGENSLNPSWVLYTDMNDDPNPQPAGMVSDLIALQQRAIVVVDNCAPQLHRRLVELCQGKESQLSLITVEYDVQEDEPEGSEVYRLEPSTLELVATLIARRFPAFSKINVRTIADFSGGNARVALALANTLEKNETLAGLKDEELFRRLFVQRQSPDESLLRGAQACALLYSFEGEKLDGSEAELPVIASLIGVTVQDLYAKVAQLRQRDLVQSRGEWRAVLPHAIANRLASMALRSIPLLSIEAAFSTDRLIRSYSRRLGYLHDDEQAVAVARKWLAPGGFLHPIGNLNSLGMAIFANIAPVSLAATLEAIERALDSANITTMGNEAIRRSQIASTLRSLAYNADLFDRSVAGLLTLADVESSTTGNSRPVKDSLKGLFHLYFSGTHALVEQRIPFVRELLRSSDPHKQQLGITLLDAMLETQHFSGGHAFEFGARTRDYGYWPSTNEAHADWYIRVFDMAEELALSNLPIALRIRKELGSNLRGVWFQGSKLQDRYIALAEKLKSCPHWSEAWLSARTALRFAKEEKHPIGVAKLRDFEKALRPKTLIERVQAIVLSGTWSGMDFSDLDEDIDGKSLRGVDNYYRANELAKELGSEVAKDARLFETLLPDLVKGNASRLPYLAMGIAISAPDKRAAWNALVQALGNQLSGERNLGALAGYLNELERTDKILTEALLDEALEHPLLGEYFVTLQCAVTITSRGVERLMRAVEFGTAPIFEFERLSYGRATDVIDGPNLERLLLAINKKPKGFKIAMSILSMHFHSIGKDKNKYPPELIELGRQLIADPEFDNHDHMQDYRLHELIDICLDGPGGASAARAFCEKFKAGMADYSIYSFNFPQSLKSMFARQPRVTLDVFFNRDSESEQDLGIDSFDDPADHRANPLDGLPDAEVLAWCAEGNNDRYVKAARAVSFFLRKGEHASEWTPIAMSMLRAAPNPVAVLEVFIERFSPRSWSGSLATILESRIPLLDALDNFENADVVALIKRKKPEIAEFARQYRESETQRDRARDERFE
jgi:hypothetical protein